MPNVPPPRGFHGKPEKFELIQEASLSRIHSVRFGPAEFNTTRARPGGGGRFDGTDDDPYAFLYAAENNAVALSESLLRDVPLDHHGRYLPRKALEDRRWRWLMTTNPVVLARLLSTSDLAAIGQDTWLTMAPASDYAETRRWAHAIRRWASWAQGLVWTSRREPTGMSFIFFGDRVATGTVIEHPTLRLPPHEARLDRGQGELLVRDLLAHYRVTLR